MPYIFCPKCGSQITIISERNDVGMMKQVLVCDKCGFRKISEY